MMQLGLVSPKEWSLGSKLPGQASTTGPLALGDLDGDGVAELIMLTEHGRVVAVNTSDGKILWESFSTNDAQSVAFADVDGDHVLDVLMAGGQTFALALSGRDGSVVWKEDAPAAQEDVQQEFRIVDRLGEARIDRERRRHVG